MTEKVTTVTIRKGTPKREGGSGGYLLSVQRRNSIWPGPRCSSRRTAREVADWIENNLI